MAVRTQKKQGVKTGRKGTSGRKAAARKAKSKVGSRKVKAAAVERPPMPKRTTRTITLADGETLTITHQERANGTPDLDPTRLSPQDLAAITAGRAQASVDMAIRKMSGQE